MTNTCFKCGQPSTTVLNVLKYCDLCFISLFESKIQKNIPKLHNDSSIFIYLNNSSFSYIVLKFLEKNFSGRKFKKVTLYCRNQEILESINTSNDENTTISGQFNINVEILNNDFSIENERSIKRDNSDIIQYCVENEYNVLIYFESLNCSIVESLELICKGYGSEAVDLFCKNKYKSLEIINIFENIKNKELLYYLKLNKIENKTTDKINDQIHETISNFITEIDDKNELAIFNIKNTFKKLYK